MASKKKTERNLKLFNFPEDGKSSKNLLKKGLLITFEGGEGSGKSTQCKRLVNKLVDEGINSILIHEPGNTALGEQVRKWVKSKSIQNPIAETYLFCAARAELCKSVIIPALETFKQLWDQNLGAAVHATNIPYTGRSHFDGQNLMETG